jgi:hypothetical protein
MHPHSDDRYDAPIEGAPTWVRVVQAMLIGLVAGLALHVLLSMVVLQGSERVTAPKECRKNTPAKSAPQQLKPQATVRPAV